jgi:monoterpene epsilon-lactone hydrolase
MASWQSYLLCTLMRWTIKRGAKSPIDVADARRRVGQPRKRVLKTPPSVQVSAQIESGLIFERIDVAAARDDLLVLYLHGGGYFFGSPQTHRQLTCGIAKQARAQVWALDYRLAPESPFPAALEDAVAAFRFLAQACPGKRILLAGDSAGGGLALATAVAVRDVGRTAALVLLSPWTDLANTGASVQTNAKSCAMFTPRVIHDAASLYCGAADPRDPGISPLYADLHGLPPMQIFASSDEILLDDARRLAAKATEQGCSVELHIVPGVPHVWPLFARVLPEGRTSLAQVGEFVARVS